MTIKKDFELITFGEAMIRLTSPEHMRLEQARTLDVTVGGAEFNVAVNAARLGHKTAWASRLVDTWAGRPAKKPKTPWLVVEQE